MRPTTDRHYFARASNVVAGTRCSPSLIYVPLRVTVYPGYRYLNQRHLGTGIYMVLVSRFDDYLMIDNMEYGTAPAEAYHSTTDITSIYLLICRSQYELFLIAQFVAR
jgi:hypothetical protein